MLSDRAMLQSLIRATRRKYVERELCCPECSGPVYLREGRLWCRGPSSICIWSGEALAELGVRT